MIYSIYSSELPLWFALLSLPSPPVIASVPSRLAVASASSCALAFSLNQIWHPACDRQVRISLTCTSSSSIALSCFLCCLGCSCDPCTTLFLTFIPAFLQSLLATIPTNLSFSSRTSAQRSPSPSAADLHMMQILVEHL